MDTIAWMYIVQGVLNCLNTIWGGSTSGDWEYSINVLKQPSIAIKQTSHN
jgi:hypothetical protein